jgi:hypothetical protein
MGEAFPGRGQLGVSGESHRRRLYQDCHSVPNSATIPEMRVASILLALVVVLSTTAAGAEECVNNFLDPIHDYSFLVAGQRFGFAEWKINPIFGPEGPSTYMYLGPLGMHG